MVKAKHGCMSANSSPQDRHRLWKRIGDEFRLACLHRREGKAAEASEILDKKLPDLIGEWARVSGLRDAERRQRLNELFEQEQRRVDDIWLSQQIILRQMRDILIPSLCLQVAEEVRDVLELQMVHVNEALDRLTHHSVRAAAPAATPNTIVPLPQVMPAERRATTPSFEDLPAIIDQLITRDLRETALHARAAALV